VAAPLRGFETTLATTLFRAVLFGMRLCCFFRVG
jgi:hypothetical protein